MALREIEPEEELTIAYVDASAPLNERRGALNALHGFTCRCERCEVQGQESTITRKLKRALRDGGGAAAAASSSSSGGAAASSSDQGGGGSAAHVETLLDDLAACGLRALDGGLYDESIAIHRKLISPEFHSALGSCSDFVARGEEAAAARAATAIAARRKRRADATLRLGGALVRVHKFDEARQVWLDGSLEFPEHEELRKEAETARAYDLSGYSQNGAGEGGGGGQAQQGERVVRGKRRKVQPSNGNGGSGTSLSLSRLALHPRRRPAAASLVPSVMVEVV